MYVLQVVGHCPLTGFQAKSGRLASFSAMFKVAGLALAISLFQRFHTSGSHGLSDDFADNRFIIHN